MKNTHTPPPQELMDLLAQTVAHGASDLHLSAHSPPMLRIHGVLHPLTDTPLSPETCGQFILSTLSESQRTQLDTHWELDFALTIDHVGRFRGNAHFSRGSLEAAFRHIPDHIPNLDSLGHQPHIHELCKKTQGLILITGMAGSGKSTTLASMIQEIAQQRSGVIISVEDPIEYLFPPHHHCLIKQREIGSDTKTFGQALRHVLRQDPDIIMISEMRDRETMQTAITAAETGHLVLATLHTIDAPKAIDRLVDAFPADQQSQILAQLANALQSIVSQRLLPHLNGQSRVLATEIMNLNHAIRACFRDRRFEQILGLMEIGTKDGMHTIDKSLSTLLNQGLISQETALAHARDPQRLRPSLSH